jgi:hypothetical protein
LATDNTASVSNKGTQKKKNMYGVYNALLPKFVHDFTIFDRAMKDVPEKNVKLAVESSFEKVTKRCSRSL